MWVGIWEWAHSVRIVVFHVNTDQRASTAEGPQNGTMDHAYYFVHCPHVTCPNWNMLLVKILDFKDLGVQKKRTIKCFLLLLWLHIEIFLILGWIKIFWIFFFTIFHAVTRKCKVVCATHPYDSHYADVGRKTWPANSSEPQPLSTSVLP